MREHPPVETEIGRIADPVERLCAFIREREAVRLRRGMGWPRGVPDGFKGPLPGEPVWTMDPILKEYRFCNVRREDDRVTRWIARQWRDGQSMGGESDVWFAMVVARFINWPDTLADIGFPVPWDPERFLSVMARRKAAKEKVYSGAYMVRAEPDMPGQGKAVYQEKVVFTPMWLARERLRPKAGDTLNSYHMLLGQFHGLGSFMAAQVVADLKYVEPLKSASDWWTFAASGPGSRRGLNFVLDRSMNAPWREDDWRIELGRLLPVVNERLGWSEPLHAQDLQNCLCEHFKYEKTRRGLGRPRARYVSHEISG